MRARSTPNTAPRGWLGARVFPWRNERWERVRDLRSVWCLSMSFSPGKTRAPSQPPVALYSASSELSVRSRRARDRGLRVPARDRAHNPETTRGRRRTRRSSPADCSCADGTKLDPKRAFKPKRASSVSGKASKLRLNRAGASAAVSHLGSRPRAVVCGSLFVQRHGDCSAARWRWRDDRGRRSRLHR